ncbi:MAG: serine/threonine-protein kinase [Planctomycetota bacterium]
MTDRREHLAQQLQQILSAQQELAERGSLPAPRDFLEQFPDIWADKLFAVDVLYNDFLLRHEISAGEAEQPRAEEYLRAFPDLAEEFSRQLELHHSLDELQPEELGRASENPFDEGARFTNREKVAEGGFADVYRAWDSQLKRSVAIKISRTAILDEESQLYLRFQREAESAAQLSHPSVVQVYEFGIEDSKPFIVSQFMEGGSLAERLQQGAVEQNQAAEWIVQICEAADYANRFGIVHRDIKPGNILFDDSSEPHLGDFGLASLSDEKSRLTEHGDVLGTPAYMSPEQAMAKSDVRPASDVYSLGVVLYELFTGQLPFQGKAHSVIQQTIHSQPEDPRKLRPSLPADLSVICLKALAKEPTARYQSPRALAEDLRRFLEHQPIQARPIGFVGKTTRFARRQPALALTLLVAFLVVGATAWLGISGIAEQRDLFRGERDRANQELYQSLLSQAESRLREKQNDWYGESLALLERAAEVRPEQPDVSRHRDLVIETLASDAPRFELQSERKLDRPPHLIAVSQDSPDVAFVSKPKYLWDWPSITYMPDGLRGSKVEFPVLGRKTCTQLEFSGAEIWALCDGAILAWHVDDIQPNDSMAARQLSPKNNIKRFCVSDSFVAVATDEGISLSLKDFGKLWAEKGLDTDGAQVLDMQFRSEQEICAALDNG